jgi:hypothetical protein
MSRTNRLLAAGILSVGVLTAAPACASGSYASYGGQRDYRDFERVAYDNGYREGLRHGRDDGEHRRDFRVDRDGDYRHADDGYRREYGDKEFYRRAFRRGYETGYREGYGREARYPGRPGYGDYGRPLPPPVTYPSGPGGVAYPREGRFYSRAAQNGYRDGFEVGRNDARDRESYDPIRSKRYREGDHDYDHSYGSRDEYKREYRAAFEQGYREGYGRRW